MKGDEDSVQIAFNAFMEKTHLAEYWCHVPNGGFRNKSVARKLKLQGVKTGVPDILIFFEPRTAIELKRTDGKGKVSKDQKKWIKMLTEQGWSCYTCHGIDEAIDVVTKRYSLTCQEKSLQIKPVKRS